MIRILGAKRRSTTQKIPLPLHLTIHKYKNQYYGLNFIKEMKLSYYSNVS